LAKKYGKEVWMTEHSVSDNIGERLPTWHEQLLFAEELNECMQAGCTGYIYWYMRAHWAFVSTGESKYGTENRVKNRLLPRAYVYSHFAKHVTGSTRLGLSSPTIKEGTEKPLEATAYINGDSLIVMAIDTTKTAHTLNLTLPYKVKSGVQLTVTAQKMSAPLFKEYVSHILMHLLTNAAEYTPAGGNIWLDFKKRSPHKYQFMVSDTGCGIPEEKHDDVFKPFLEIRDLTTGDGLGLPICKQMAQNMNGDLAIDPQFTKGARFVLDLNV
jgi:hypothetical protein